MTLYERILRERMDMTEWVIHFTRPRDGRSARDNLLSIAVNGVLRPGWSPRRGRATVYGSRPCVCFTEQPLWAFAEYVRLRGGEHLSGYGVLVHKRDLFADGGRPVVYGGDLIREISEQEDDFVPGQRTLRGMPLEEQYRYVAFNPNALDGAVDWTHEREWRWPKGANAPVPESLEADELGSFLLAGSMVHGNSGLSLGRTHLLVEHDDDIRWLQQELAQVTTTGNDGDWHHRRRWRSKLGSSVGVFSLETVVKKLKAGANGPSYGRLETWPPSATVAVAGGIATGVTRQAKDLLDS